MRERNPENAEKLLAASVDIYASVQEIPYACHKLTLREYQALKALVTHGAVYEYKDFPTQWPGIPQTLIKYLMEGLENYGYIYQGKPTALGHLLVKTVEGK